MNTLNLEIFDPISLAQMSGVKLMNRVDTKYVTTLEKLRHLLIRLADDYFIQAEGNVRMFPYYTVYFDTPDCRMYNMHLAGHKTRQKIRMRCYLNSGSNFLEIKRKNNKGRTKKKRIAIDKITSDALGFSDFIADNSAYRANGIMRQIENRFRRITLVNRNFTERLTIDTGLRFHNIVTGKSHELPGIAIIELKRDGATYSPALRHLNDLRIFPSGFSKYCMGMVFTNPHLRSNRFKERARMVMKMNGSKPPFFPLPEAQQIPLPSESMP